MSRARERTGVQAAAGGHITAIEHQDQIKVLSHGMTAKGEVYLTVEEALHFARCIRRIARRVEVDQ